MFFRFNLLYGHKLFNDKKFPPQIRKSQARIRNFLITSIVKDGTLSGPDFETLNEISRNPELKIIAAGGISQIEDLINLKRIGIQGAVIGKALYEEKFTLKEALKQIGRK